MGVPIRSEGEKTPKRMSARQLRDTGLLHVINETLLWQLGIVMTVDVERGHISFLVQDEVVTTGLDDDAHKAKHRAYDRLVKTRRKLVGREQAEG